LKAAITIGLSTTQPLEEVAQKIGALFGVSMGMRDSQYLGGSYYRGVKDGGEEFVVRRNFDVVEKAPAIPEASDCPVLLKVDRTEQAAEDIVKKLVAADGSSARVLRTEPSW
jgi:hypothetical protein